MEARNERERYIKNPARLLRCAIELAGLALRKVDDNLYTFEDGVESRPYSSENYPPCGPVDGPYETEEDLLWQQD